MQRQPNLYDGPAEMYYNGRRLYPGTPEADELARKILKNLYECAAASQGCRLASITITKKEES